MTGKRKATATHGLHTAQRKRGRQAEPSTSSMAIEHQERRKMPDISALRRGQSPIAVQDEKIATVRSWYDKFEGKAPQALREHIRDCCNAAASGGGAEYQGKFISIIQSSGMGKSRLVDEFSRSSFLIPINLRPGKNGYPPEDNPAKDYFKFSPYPKISSISAHRRCYSFLTALFLEAAKIVEGFEHLAPAERPLAFYDYLSEEMMFNNHGPNRVKYYQDVQDCANLLSAELAATSVSNLLGADALKNAITTLIQKLDMTPKNPNEPIIFVAFDEAHFLCDALQDRRGNPTNTSYMAELRSNLEIIRTMPVFTLFLSTTAKISSLALSCGPDISPSLIPNAARLLAGDLKLMPAFSDIGYDQLMLEDQVDEGTHTLKQVTDTKFMAKFGRPLWGLRLKHDPQHDTADLRRFALMKLLSANVDSFENIRYTLGQEFACLSQRLALELDSKTHVAVEGEREQVERHMRLCLQVDDRGETMTTASPSEPILAEAASVAMKRMKVPLVMKGILEEYSINQGDRGEVLAALLLTMARDAVIHDPDKPWHHDPIVRTLPLFEKLFTQYADIKVMTPTFSPTSNSTKTFEQMLAKSATHFNHFVKLREHGFLMDKHLVLLMARGAFALCASGDTSVNLIGVALRDQDELISSSNIIFLFQVKNNPTYTHIPQDQLFDAMDPFSLKLVKEGTEDVVVVRIVFALNAKPSITAMPARNIANSSFTAYDIWCSGLTPEVFALIQGDREKNTWDALLYASQGWQKMYEGNETATGLRQQQNAAAAAALHHWSSWAKSPPPPAPKKSRKGKGKSKSSK